MRIRIVAALTATALALGTVDAAAAAAPAQASATTTARADAGALSTPVYFIHGFEYSAKDDCAGTWGDAEKEARRSGLTGPFITWGAYKNDIGCTRKVGGNQNTRIQELGRLLAWDIYDNYSKKGRPVDVLAHSMGGLVIAAAVAGVHRYGASSSAWPHYLLVSNVATLSTPWSGASALAALCTLWKRYMQCNDLRPGSGFLRWLASYQNPQGRGGTDWTVIGAFDDKTVHATSGAGMKAKHSVLYTSGQGITHARLPHLVSGSTWKVQYSNDFDRSATATSTAGGPARWAVGALHDGTL
jgi:hypothetical protein